ncbi:protein of unknown function [Methylacidimicrobium sp. AP8]|uniref:class I SAM-dependent methyltransferase n=1 Tax=Methylacidimicrobium sp. AP8 TaxID=2730359 RepID=UPI0018C1CD76|nr:class I SAM-dependent methyltransferase [Methylacidimicrobium sp. AP8]CAB4242816.1 protein of unknown function [Methylacidimicrobium sp. AP8]
MVVYGFRNGIDHWRGDEQAGEYGSEVLEDLRRHHDPRYGGFSRLLRESFEEALPRFAKGSIDLLHIDGLHSYQAVRRDFCSWLPRVSVRGVVLLHDVAVRREGFGVWRLWEEVSKRVSLPCRAQRVRLGSGGRGAKSRAVGARPARSPLSPGGRPWNGSGRHWARRTSTVAPDPGNRRASGFG